jgi:hypothetical protein
MEPPNPDVITMDPPKAAGNSAGGIDTALHPPQSVFMKWSS